MHFVVYNRLTAIAGFYSAIACVQVLRHHIERQPYIDVRDESGTKLQSFSADCGYRPTVTFNNVTFAYPSRPEIKALDDVSLTAEAGQLTAFVGPSGAGKSSIASLLVRQYDPGTANLPHPYDRKVARGRKEYQARLNSTQTTDTIEKGHLTANVTSPTPGPGTVQGSGTIHLNGIDLRKYNLRSLRSQISVVHQEPQLLTGSVFENIALGLAGTPLEYQKDRDGQDKEKFFSTRELCVDALKKAEAWDFVQDLPEGMDTQITGGRSGILSGGQQQRLAIARALIGRPAVLILDEATSALSSDVELRVRNNLEEEQRQRNLTIISIAHRLQFAQLAHKIVVMREGHIVDTGTYSELSSSDRPDQTFAHLLNTNSSKRNQVISASLKENDVASHKSATNSISNNFEKLSSVTSDIHDVGSMSDHQCKIQHDADKSTAGLLHYVSARRMPFLMMILCVVLNAGSRVVFQLRVGQSGAKLIGAVDSMSMGAHALIWLGHAFWWSAAAYGQESFAGVTQKGVERRLISASVESLFRQEVSYYEEEVSSAGMLTASLAKHTASIAETSTTSLTRVCNKGQDRQFGLDTDPYLPQ
jgi:ATP-binding cassette subfamily B (MDR/TAP) protein 1